MNSFKLSKLINIGNKSLFDIPSSKQRTYIKLLGIARNDMERSYKQYLCQHIFIPFWKRFLLNVLSFLSIPFSICFFFFKGMFAKRATQTIGFIGEFDGLEDVLPAELIVNNDINNKVWFEANSLSISDILFVCSILKKYFFNSYFVFKIMIKVSKYSYMIKRYNPVKIIVHNEYSFTSSVLTAYCEQHNIEHINVMHGEKLFFIRDSFFRYHKCYVWDEHYKQLFISLMAEPTQFRIALPSYMSVDINTYYNPEYYADYKYYLALYTEKQLRSIIDSMAILEKKGKSIRYRPHPRYSNITMLEKYVEKKLIEYPNEASIQTSIASTLYCIGSYTTVLNQAYYSGKSVVVDDMTFCEQYEKLKDLNYKLNEINHLKLSQIQ